MPNLTVVFEYPDDEQLDEAASMFQKGNIPNLVDIAKYNAIAAHDNLHERFLGDENKEELAKSFTNPN